MFMNRSFSRGRGEARVGLGRRHLLGRAEALHGDGLEQLGALFGRELLLRTPAVPLPDSAWHRTLEDEHTRITQTHDSKVHTTNASKTDHDHRREDVAGRHRVDGHAVARKLAGEREGEPDQRACKLEAGA